MKIKTKYLAVHKSETRVAVPWRFCFFLCLFALCSKRCATNVLFPPRDSTPWSVCRHLRLHRVSKLRPLIFCPTSMQPRQSSTKHSFFCKAPSMSSRPENRTRNIALTVLQERKLLVRLQVNPCGVHDKLAPPTDLNMPILKSPMLFSSSPSSFVSRTDTPSSLGYQPLRILPNAGLKVRPTTRCLQNLMIQTPRCRLKPSRGYTGVIKC